MPKRGAQELSPQQVADDPNADRVKNPRTSSTPTTFKLNWSWSVNGPYEPTPEAGVCTFMGPWEEEGAHRIKAALDIMREHGYRCQQDDYHEDLEVLGKSTDDIVFVVTETCGWLHIRCATKEAEDFVLEHLAILTEESRPDFRMLGRVPHVEVTTKMGDSANGVTMTSRTGNGAGEDGISTLFELKKGTKIVAKSLCTYANIGMQNPGPTIELFEVAEEWRCQGYAKLLLQGITDHFENMFFAHIEEVKFNVFRCETDHAHEWFRRQGFRDWDDSGEELGKYLGVEALSD
mmetsp:Transcript_45506/g.110215  ORF Transcript_45506/g.110215 Transcript_45506/m.110215 type:complete len:291 (+) Transcript_45506:217-1089(+)|eukprot:CAMPEP_0113607802 /NCGR_PEP_ID=MMETSP0017_2-20120614/3581_1 /TAXON_ID=2856 /ORGANISM="Cylindrotheca closterium" /LENGTH=290 /DNA_ID=CAMNT_0000516435 /DNA_START=117 /DNA_END=989 /DNA_ORIENTATION=+ /assembly_acc=CAM_ASM_000147